MNQIARIKNTDKYVYVHPYYFKGKLIAYIEQGFEELDPQWAYLPEEIELYP